MSIPMSRMRTVRRALLAAGLGVMLNAARSGAEVPPLRVHFIAVGQGDATLFEFPCKKTVLVDTGGESNAELDGRQALLAYLDRFFAARPELGRKLSLLAITHPHRDHTQAVRAVLEGYDVEKVLVGGRRSGSGWYWEESEAAGDRELRQGQSVLLEQVPAARLRAIEFPRLSDVTARQDGIIDPVDCRGTHGEGIDPKIRVLWGPLGQDPGWGYREIDGKRKYHFDNENDHSLVIRVDYGKSSILITGDLEYAQRSDGTATAAIPDLLRRYGSQAGGLLDADVYKVGHHGSANGTSDELLRAITPQVAVLSMGPYDRRGPWHDPFPWTAYQYGHPRKSVVTDLQREVGLRRLAAAARQVATGVRSFEPMTIDRCILGTGWEGSLVLTAYADGRLDVAPAAGGGSLCAGGGPGVPAMAAAAPSADAAAGGEAAPLPPVAALFSPQLLAPRPLCEASAALAAPWDESLVLVADNERDEQLYVFALADGELAPELVAQMPAKQRPNDVEALARLGNEVVVVGSHSRNSKCEAKPNRQRLRRLAPRPDGTLEATAFLDSAAAWSKAMEGGGARCLQTLFVQPAPAGAVAVCDALATAEREAAMNAGSCETLNVEGAFGTADGSLWLGLRAPLAEGRAVLLRLVAGFTELRFDRVALLDLEGRGVRELALAGDQLYGLAGPVRDADVPFALFRAGVAAVEGGGSPPIEIVRRDLLPSSEGLLIRDGRAYVLLDGDEGGRDGACKVPAGWYAVDLR